MTSENTDCVTELIQIWNKHPPVKHTFAAYSTMKGALFQIFFLV